MTFLPPVALATITERLEEDGYAIIDDAMEEHIPRQLLQHLYELSSSNNLDPARIGRGDNHTRRSDIRSDHIHWLSPDIASDRIWPRAMEALRLHLNRHLLLGLFSYECHFSHYPPGAYYRTHLDAFRGEANRVLSTVFYLNEGWQLHQGGELVIYNSDNHPIEVVTPEFNRLVVFLSEEFPHEVRPTVVDRYSIAGWFRVNSSRAERSDPPV